MSVIKTLGRKLAGDVIPEEVHGEIVKHHKKRADYYYALLYLAAKANGGKLIIPKHYMISHGDKIGGLTIESTFIEGGKVIEVRD